MILFPKKLRPPQMWWVIEQQARRRRAHSEIPPAPAMAEWFPHDAAGLWDDVDANEFTGDWDVFSVADLTSITLLDLTYAGITSISGLETLPALTMVVLTYNPGIASSGFPLLPVSIEKVDLSYCGLTDVPDFTAYPNIDFLVLSYNGLSAAQMDAIFIQLDANGKLNGTLDLSQNGNEPTAASGAARASLEAKGWLLSFNI